MCFNEDILESTAVDHRITFRDSPDQGYLEAYPCFWNWVVDVPPAAVGTMPGCAAAGYTPAVWP